MSRVGAEAMAVTAELSLATLPVDRVIRLSGVTADQLAVALDPLPEGAPVVIQFRLQTATSAAAVIDEVLDRLTQVTVELFPAWLPDGDLIDGGGTGLDRRAVHTLARRHAATSEHFAPFLAAVAEAAVTGRGAMTHFPAETRARGLARLIAEAYRRDAVVLLVTSAEMPETHQHAAGAAFEWLSQYGRFGFWVADQALPAVDRFRTVPLVGRAVVPESSTAGRPQLPVVQYPALVGRPHPASDVEKFLARCLDECEWAAGRKWNAEYRGHQLMPTIRVDLMWEDEQCVVEIDGPDHRSAEKYADDRRRDNTLVLDGYVVLRFTNDEVVDDVARVLDTIERLLRWKRQQKGVSS